MPSSYSGTVVCSRHYRGVVHVTGASSLWRTLRPTLLAGAAALTWLTVSSTAASADTLPEPSSLLGSVTSSVASVGEALPTLSPGVESGRMPASVPTGLLQPAAAPLAGAVDSLITSVPVVNHVVPANTVSAVTAPVTAVADNVAVGAIGAVVSPLTEAVPVLEPVVQPITDLVGGIPPLPGDLPEPPQLPAAPNAEPTAESTGISDGTAAPESIPASAGSVTAEDPELAAAPATSEPAYFASYPTSGVNPIAVVGEQTVPSGGSPYPAHAPAPPVSGGGSSTASGTGSGPAAWLDAFSLQLPLAGNSLVGEYSKHAPSPVFFDPGSSPD